MRMTKKEFFDLVIQVHTSIIKTLPPNLQKALQEVLIIVQDNPENDDEKLLGLYDGIPLSDRGVDNMPLLPDKIYIYRIPLLHLCRNRSQLRREIRATIIHELGHLLGFDDDELETMGLD